MGDILHSLPAVTALREAHPGWFLGWAIEPQWRELFGTGEARPGTPAMPLVDRVHIVPAKRWAKSPLSPATLGDIRRVRRELREAQYDVAVDLQGAVRSAMIARWARTGKVIGEAAPREPIAKWLFQQRVATSGVHVIEQSLEVVNAILRERLPVMLPYLPHDADADERAARLAQPFVLISPGAGWGAKRWPAERYGAVASTLAKAGYGVVINAGAAGTHSGEEKLAEEIVQSSAMYQSPVPVQPLAMSIAELTAVTRRASLVIAGDTGPLHLACALGRPVVGIFGPTDPARNGPFGCAFRVLRHPESVRDHTRRVEPEAGLLTITPEAVADAALELLQETP
ncbi:glycosyltransferase family 9 protein [Acidipila sp. 4G-K13]|uniref:Glycosyltransferase family 9 protein n=2 Tax=Paracidobacterium acidisoli TaxID=2303751 RepID=A0A372IJK0_9BACT|nr:glycosyltransferase family 9 protein [Paracidobacterium acidisoli]